MWSGVLKIDDHHVQKPILFEKYLECPSCSIVLYQSTNGWSVQKLSSASIPSAILGTFYKVNCIFVNFFRLCFHYVVVLLVYTRPAQHTARGPHAACENSVAENVANARLRIITCPFRISSKLWRNRLLRPAASLCWSIWPFELSELCRPGVYFRGLCILWFRYAQKCLLKFVMRRSHVSLTSRLSINSKGPHRKTFLNGVIVQNSLRSPVLEYMLRLTAVNGNGWLIVSVTNRMCVFIILY